MTATAGRGAQRRSDICRGEACRVPGSHLARLCRCSSRHELPLRLHLSPLLHLHAAGGSASPAIGAAPAADRSGLGVQAARPRRNVVCLHRRLPWPQRRQRSAFAASSRSVVTAAPRKNTSAADRLSPDFRRCAAQRDPQSGAGLQRRSASRALISLGTATTSGQERRALASGRCAPVRSATTETSALAVASGRSAAALSRCW